MNYQIYETQINSDLTTKEVIVSSGVKNLNGYVSTNRKTFSITKSEILSVLSLDSSLTKVGNKLVVKAEVYADEPNNPRADVTTLPGTINF